MDGDYPANIALTRNDSAIRVRDGLISHLSLSCSAVIIYLILYIVCQGKYSVVLPFTSHLLKDITS